METVSLRATRAFRRSRSVILPLLATALLLLAPGCATDSDLEQEGSGVLDLDETVKIRNIPNGSDARPLRIAIASITSPRETLSYYDGLLHHISQELNRPVRLERRKSYWEVNELIRAKQIDLAFICSGAFVDAKDRFPIELVVSPVVNGSPTYRAYVIVRKDSDIRHFEELRGRSFYFTDRLSNTGYHYGLRRLEGLDETPDSFFDSYHFSGSHDYSIRAVAERLADGATIDGLIFDYFSVHYPEVVKDLEVIERSPEYGMPPVVVHGDTPPEEIERIRSVFLNLHETERGAALLGPLMIDRFRVGHESEYDSIEIIEDNRLQGTS